MLDKDGIHRPVEIENNNKNTFQLNSMYTLYLYEVHKHI